MEVVKGVVWVDAEVLVNRGPQVIRAQWPLDGEFRPRIGGSDDLAVFHAAAGQGRAGDPGPVVPSAFLVELRSAAEFTPHHHTDVLIQTAVVQVLDEGRQSVIQLRENFAGLRKVARMPVPAVETQGDATHASFDEAARHQELLRTLRSAVVAALHGASPITGPDLGILLVEIQSLGQAAGRQDAHGLLLEAEVYDDPEFKRSLVEAAESLTVGSVWDLPTKMGPLIRPPSGDLQNALLTLEDGESWALMPCKLDGNDCLWSPGIKWGVQPGSYTHMTEFFGPVLGVMRFEKLQEAIAMVNQTGFGLTSGLESLDDREQAEWKAGIRAGNLYINRGTTGAVVLRQPFGGMGKSAFGPGLKAGGPNYVAQFMKFQETPARPGDEPLSNPALERLALNIVNESCGVPEEQYWRTLKALESCDQWWSAEFGREHDRFRLIGQDNVRRYLPLRAVHVRVSREDSLFEIFTRVAATRVTGARTIVSTPLGLDTQELSLLEKLTHDWAGLIEFVVESDEELAEAIGGVQVCRVRYAAAERVPEIVRRAAAEACVFIADAPVLAEGRVELLWYVQEQSVSFDYHRYGNLGTRSGEERAPLVAPGGNAD